MAVVEVLRRCTNNPMTITANPIPTVPDETDKRGYEQQATEKPEQQDRSTRIFRRLNAMLEFKRPYEVTMERSYLLFDGISRLNPREPPEIEYQDIVQPFAAIFVETKTAEEYGATSDFEFMPIDDDDDVWRVELNMECVEHARRVYMAQANKLDGLRTKNIAGVSIKRKGYRYISRTVKVESIEDEYGRVLSWKEMEVPWYDDLFEQIIDPFDFVVDPNATNMNNAVDCGQFSRLNWEDAYEIFGKDPRFSFKDIKPGLDNMVEFFEYFNGPRDEWCIFAWPSTGARYSLDHSRRPPGGVKEIYFGPLPDKHKMLPFTSQHTNPSFITGFFSEVIGRSPETGEETTHGENIIGHRVFWTPGIPVQISDLINTRTNFGKQALEALKVAATNIIATEGHYRFNNKKKWKNGEQAIGMKDKFQIMNGAQAHVGDFEFHFNDLYEQMVQRLGVDPRNITDSKQKTATEDIAQRESSAKRLNAEIEYNEIIEGVRDGILTYHLIQQHYTRQKMVRLSGNESDEELKKYDETMGTHPITGKPLVGKRYRRITTRKPMKEFTWGGKNMLAKSEQGKNSFLSRPEYIQTSEVNVIVMPKRRAGQVKALLAQQATDDITVWNTFFAMTQPGPTGTPPALSVDQLPNFDRLVEKWVLSRDGNPAKDIGQKKKSPKMAKIDQARKVLSNHTPFNSVMNKMNAQPQDMGAGQQQAPQQPQPQNQQAPVAALTP
jgi:hypothetical protein